MELYSFVDRFFHSVKELTDIRESGERDINTLFTFLENLHAFRDKLKKQFIVDIAEYPEFKFLKIIRNFFHHADDVNEYRMYLKLENDILVSPSHMEQIIIPVSVIAKSIKHFKETHPNTYVENELNTILDIIDSFDLIRHPELFINNCCLKCDGIIIELGFDIFKYVYNISNIIADKCRSIDALSKKGVIINLEKEYSSKNNVPKYDMLVHPGANMILTTQGYIYPKTIERAM
jgi:hypothetical protein